MNKPRTSERSITELEVHIDVLCDALFWISEYPNRVLPHEGQEEHAVELAEHARDALSLHDERLANHA